MSEQVDVAAAGREGGRVDDWVVVIEAKPERAGDTFDFGLVQEVLHRLRQWRPSCMYNPRHYEIQMHIAAVAPSEALRAAVANHDRAVQALSAPPPVRAVPAVGAVPAVPAAPAAPADGLAHGSLTRAEVLSRGEFENGLGPVAGGPEEAEWAEGDGGGGEGAGPTAGSRCGLISDLLYRTTRALLRVSSSAEITDLLVGFVTEVGGSISVGDGHLVRGMVAVALSGDQDEPLQAVAETMSVAGLIIERYLPSLVEDADRVRRHVRPAST